MDTRQVTTASSAAQQHLYTGTSPDYSVQQLPAYASDYDVRAALARAEAFMALEHAAVPLASRDIGDRDYRHAHRQDEEVDRHSSAWDHETRQEYRTRQEYDSREMARMLLERPREEERRVERRTERRDNPDLSHRDMDERGAGSSRR